eukprot:NODE_4110_length_861_cov_25.318966_g3792_i0.p1 GENE.NODE_4110_length_861_cov_25.318966_g3792_i0~~NODE_4110_length_861_cov_25.318966_g3792_i0.p1  ORF type:complete len:201 (+),score=54.35 NODE_4110_length_861_cov_25.318966_g3792_i0:65-604(+)
MSAFHGVTVTSLATKETVELASLWKNRRCVITLLRRFGCGFCHHQAQLLMDIKAQLDEKNVALIAIGNGSEDFARDFADNLPWTGEVYLDSKSSVYAALNLKRWGLMETLSRFGKTLGFSRDLYKRFPHANFKGDGQQSGAVFVIGPGDESVKPVYLYKEEEGKPTEFANPADILKALQ